MDISQLTEDDWKAIRSASIELTGEADIRDLVTNYGDDSLSFTRDTVADFDDARENSWQERGRRDQDEFAVYFRRVQAFKGHPRYDLAVIDCGDFRALLQV